jgi:type IV pilus assembly protein PilV
MLRKGFGLVEALITMAIISVGILLYAGIQVKNLREQRNLQQRNAASMLVNDLAGRMRANPNNLQQYNISTNASNSSYINSYIGGSLATALSNNTNCTGGANNVACTPSQMALQDLYEWHTLVTSATYNLLRNPQWIVCVDSTPSTTSSTPATSSCDNVFNTTTPTLVIKLWWDEINNDGSISTTSYPRVVSVAYGTN